MGMKDKIFDVVIPTQEEIEVKEGKRKTIERHIFPGLCLGQHDSDRRIMVYRSKYTGRYRICRNGNQPTPLRPEE